VTDERWGRVKALFQLAVEKPASERDAFLASLAGGDEALRREVQSLLAADVGETLAPPILSGQRRIGSYEIVGLLGAGAMGEV